MRLIFVIRSLANLHGVERTITDKINYFAENGHDVAILTYEQGSHPFAFPLSSQAKIKHVDLDCRYFPLYQFFFLKRLCKSWKLRTVFKDRLVSFVKDFNPDAIITTTYSGEFMKEIIYTKKYAHIIVESHSAYIYDFMEHSFLQKIRHFFSLYAIRKCNLIIALTEGDSHFWKKLHNRVLVVPNPVTYYCEDVRSLQRDRGRIICVGRLYEPKRFDRLIDAFSMIADRHPDWYIDIYGDGEDRGKLQNRIESAGLSGRVFLRLSTDNIFDEYQKSQMMVVSSDHEGFSLVLIEAMACGVPVVSTACPYGPSEIVEDGVSGLLCKLEVKDLAEKMEWMITHEKERAEMGEKAHSAALRYKKEYVMKEWESAYLSVL